MGQLDGSSRPTDPWPALDGPSALQRHSCAFWPTPAKVYTLLISASRLANDLAERTVSQKTSVRQKQLEIYPAPPGGPTDPH
jgi:hypothetical protein